MKSNKAKVCADLLMNLYEACAVMKAAGQHSFYKLVWESVKCRQAEGVF